MTRVAFIGLGRMGHGMAGRYLEAGFTVSVWNRSKAKAEDLIARGARWATSPEDAAIDADAVVTMVADDNASREVWLTKDGAAATMKAGTLAIECSTVSYGHALELARELRSRGLIYIDSPVTGLPDAAASPQVLRHSKRMVARNFSGATFTAALRHKDAAYAVALAESLLSDVPLMGRAAVESYERAKTHAPDDDEGKLIEIVSRAKDATN
jgi:3-hydroxyisobutyrate dehydrogenase-like beta-hydroxyacid dehydrogenase